MIYDFMIVNLVLTPDLKIYMLIVGLSALILCLFKPDVGFIMYLLSIFFLTFLTDSRVPIAFLPRWVGYSGDLLMISLIFGAIARQIVGREKIKPTYYDLLITLLLIVTFFSWWVNSVPLFTALGGIRFILVMVSGYFILHYGGYSKSFMEKIFKIILIISMVQLPLTIFQRFIGVELLGWGADMVAGSFSRYTGLVSLQIIVLALGTAGYIMKDLDPKISRILKIAGIMAFFSLTLSNARVVWLEIPLILVIVIMSKFGTSFKRVVKYTSLFALIYIVGLIGFEFLYGGIGVKGEGVIPYLTNPDRVYEYMTTSKGGDTSKHLQRGAAFIFVKDRIGDSSGGWIFGLGPGMMTEFKYSFAVSGYTKLFQEVRANIVQASTFLGEWGLSGFLISIAFIFAWLKRIRKLSSDTVLQFSNVIRTAYPAITIHFFIMQFYSRVWFENNTSIVFWFFTVYLIREWILQKNQSSMPETVRKAPL